MRIAIDFVRVMLQAQQLEELAEELRREGQDRLGGAFSEVSSAWKGEAAEAYLRKGNAYQEKIVKTANELSQTAAALRSAAKRLHDAEQHAIELAKH